MRDIACFSNNVVAAFDNEYQNIVEFNDIVLDASHGVFNRYSKEETNKIIRTQFDKILGINFKEATPMKRRQAWREHSKEIAALVEDVILDKMQSGWNASNARFMEYVEQINLADGDKNEFYVTDNSLLQVSKFAGNHHDINSYSVRIA